MSLPLLPTLGELLDPATQPAEVRQAADATQDELDPIHLFDMTWVHQGQIHHRVMPRALTGTRATIVMMSGRHFPTGSHKVGPAYSCLREKLLAGEIEQDGSTLVFPSTGNYGIGGAWVGPRVGFSSLVVLPEEMSAERFDKIRAYGAEIVATPGSESNVKEIYDKVAELRQDPNMRILNQFADFGNYRFHRHVTGGSAVALGEQLVAEGVGTRISGFVSAMGSAGTLAAADQLKSRWGGCKAIGVEPVQCPTLYNVGFGAHAIEGIGDKHVTWIHNVRSTDLLVCVDDRDCLFGLQLLQEGHETLASELGLDTDWLASIEGMFGVSGVCNLLASIRACHHYGLGEGDIVMSVATDGFDRYPSVLRRLDQEHGPMTAERARKRTRIFSDPARGRVLEGTMEVRQRWHNQKYFTWVEQQGMSLEQLNQLWDPGFWEAEYDKVPALDEATLALRQA
jgi:cysteine synthase A